VIVFCSKKVPGVEVVFHKSVSPWYFKRKSHPGAPTIYDFELLFFFLPDINHGQRYRGIRYIFNFAAHYNFDWPGIMGLLFD